MSEIGHNNMVGEELGRYLDRIDRIKEEIDGLNGDIKDIKAEMKGRGFDMKVVAEMMKLRKMSKSERDEWEAVRDSYGTALGIFG